VAGQGFQGWLGRRDDQQVAPSHQLRSAGAGLSGRAAPASLRTPETWGQPTRTGRSHSNFQRERELGEGAYLPKRHHSATRWGGSGWEIFKRPLQFGGCDGSFHVPGSPSIQLNIHYSVVSENVFQMKLTIESVD
jgi:hypothetical protein